LALPIYENKIFLEEKEMTTKKSKKYDLTNKTDFKHRPKEAVKKKSQNINKGIDTFFPISN